MTSKLKTKTHGEPVNVDTGEKETLTRNTSRQERSEQRTKPNANTPIPIVICRSRRKVPWMLTT